VVVDVGTGTGIRALAARFGARKVYAIDLNPYVNSREVAANGFAQTIEFIHKVSSRWSCRRKPTSSWVTVAEFPRLRSEPRDHAARVKPGLPEGVLVVEKDDLYVSLVHRPELQRELHTPWNLFGFDWTACRREAFLTRMSASEPNGDLRGSLTEPAIWATVDYRRLQSPNVNGHAALKVRESGTVHAVASWFRATTAFGHQFGDHAGVYHPLLLPIEPPLDVHEGESTDVELKALRTKDGYLMAWTVTTPRESRRFVNDGLSDLVITARSRT
jgi:hypothetical protein